VITVCWKWTRYGGTAGDDRWAGTSDCDQAALEVGLRLAATRDDTVTVISVGDAGSARGLRAALAAGASRAVHVSAPDDLVSAAVAAAIAATLDLRDVGDATRPHWIVCGAASADRGSGSVPAFLAAELAAAQALGLVAVDVEPSGVPGAPLRVVRRLDGGRREVLAVRAPAVLSVEGSVARLRRASLPAELAAADAPIDIVTGPAGPREEPLATAPYRPRARAMAAPSGDTLARIRLLTDARTAPAATTETVVLDPPAAAARIIDALIAWGYLDAPDPPEPSRF